MCMSFLSLVCLILSALSLRDPSSMIFYSNLTSPFQQTLRAYGNYDFKANSFNFTGANEKKAAQLAIQSFINYYGKAQYPKQANYSLQYYQDSSLSVVTYILYKKISLSVTIRYYSLRVREGTRRGAVYQLGNDTCNNCLVGRQLLFGYQQYSEAKINEMGLDIVNIVNSMRNMKLQTNSVKQLKAWNFPKGILIIANISAPSSTSDILVSMLSTPEQYLLYLNGYSIPRIYSNLPIDYSYLSSYMLRILQASGLDSSNQTYLRTFEYILDENFKNVITFSLRYVNLQLSGIIKLYNGAAGSTLPAPYDIYLHPSTYFKTTAFTPYFDYNDPHQNIGSNTTSQKQSKQLLSYLTNKLNYRIDFIDFIYIDFASSRRQYNLVYNDSKTGEIIQAIMVCNKSLNNSFGSVYKRAALPNQTYTESENINESYWSLYEIADNYGMMSYNLNYSFTQGEISAAEICSVFSMKFELAMIYNNNPSKIGSKDYCMTRKIFIKNTSSNRTHFLGQSIVSSSQCTYFGLKAFITQSCPLKQPSEASSTAKSLIFSTLKDKLIDSKGLAYTQNISTQFIEFGLKSFGIGEVYYAAFNRNGVNSYYFIQQSNSAYQIMDYMENFTNADYPNLGAGPQNPINSTNSSMNNNTNSSTNKLITEQNSQVKSIGEGDLPVQFIANQYQHLMELIKKNANFTNSASKPTIFYYVDVSINFFAFAVFLPYVYSVFEVYQIVKLQNTNQYYYMGRKYLPKIPQSYWQSTSIPESSSAQLLSQITSIINENAACYNIPIKAYEISSLPLKNGGFYVINAQMMNGYNSSIGLFRLSMKWMKVFSQFTINQVGPIISSKPEMTVQTKYQIQSDLSFKQSLSMLAKQLSLLGNLPLSKIEKGVFTNGTIQYQLTFDLNTVAKGTVMYLYDPTQKKILYLDNSSISSIQQSIKNTTKNEETLTKILQTLTQKYTILKNYQSLKSQVSYLQGSALYNLKIKAFDKNTYISDVIITAPSVSNEKINVVSFYRQL